MKPCRADFFITQPHLVKRGLELKSKCLSALGRLGSLMRAGICPKPLEKICTCKIFKGRKEERAAGRECVLRGRWAKARPNIVPNCKSILKPHCIWPLGQEAKTKNKHKNSIPESSPKGPRVQSLDTLGALRQKGG